MRRLETNDWWPDLVGLKDELSLRELSERFEVTPGAISAAFKRTGTARKSAPPGPRALRKGRVPVPAASSEAAAPAAQRPAASSAGRPGSKDANIEAFRSSLGRSPDAEVARKAGVSVRTLATYRARLGIPAYSGPRRPVLPGPRGSRIDPLRDLLGRVPDRVVADRAGVTLNAVRNYRAKHGISAAGRDPVVSLGAPPAAQRDGPEPTFAWRILLQGDDGEEVRVVFGRDVIEAARQAASRAAAPVVALQWVGEVI